MSFLMNKLLPLLDGEEILKELYYNKIMQDLEAAETVRDLLETMQAAIAAGDWKVDGACDPDMAIERAETFMRDQGYRLDGLTGTEWIYEG